MKGNILLKFNYLQIVNPVVDLVVEPGAALDHVGYRAVSLAFRDSSA